MKNLKLSGIKKLTFFLIIFLCNIGIFSIFLESTSHMLDLTYDLSSSVPDSYQLYYSESENITEENSQIVSYTNPNIKQSLRYSFGEDIRYIRIDLGMQPANIILDNLRIGKYFKSADMKNILVEKAYLYNQIESIYETEDGLHIMTNGGDPYIMIALEPLEIEKLINKNQHIVYCFKVIICLLFDIVCVIAYRKRACLKKTLGELYSSRVLMMNLAKNDFKTRFAGSYLGIIWAFIQPIVTVLIYWFVFEVGFKSAPTSGFPFVLWLISGIVPWFFFSEAIINATNSMLEYTYLVKKVVFKISILPIVKIISALFVHIFFIILAIIIFMLNGYMLSIHIIQVIYYSVCTFFLIAGIVYATSAMVIFFRDLGQIVNIFLQIAMWLTPIMWSYEMISPSKQWILKLNPMYYIVEGYRDAFINHIWFWEKSGQTTYFWLICGGTCIAGMMIFRKLKPHFADVL